MPVQRVKALEHEIVESAKSIRSSMREKRILDDIPLFGSFPYAASLKQQIVENFICNIPYFAQYPNPNGNRLVVFAGRYLLTASLGARLRGSDDTTAKFNSGICLPKTIFGTVRGNCNVERISSRLEKILQYEDVPDFIKEEGITQEEIAEAQRIWQDVLDELAFYEGLEREGYNALTTTAYFRRLLTIWVAKQMVDRKWADYDPEGIPAVSLEDYKLPRNFYGCILFDSPQWLLGGNSFRDGMAIGLVDALRNENAPEEYAVAQYRSCLLSEWNAYCDAAESDATPNGYLIADDDLRLYLRDSTVPELYERFEKDVARSAYPSCVQHKANFIFGLLYAAFTGDMDRNAWPFRRADVVATENITRSMEIPLSQIAPSDNALYLHAGKVSIAVYRNAMGAWLPRAKSVDLNQVPLEQRGMALLFAGREFDPGKWDCLKEAVRDAVREAFAHSPEGGAAFESLVGKRIDALFAKKAPVIADLLRQAAEAGKPFLSNADRSGLAAWQADCPFGWVRVESAFEEEAAHLSRAWSQVLKGFVNGAYASVCQHYGEDCVDIPLLRGRVQDAVKSFFEESGLGILFSFAGETARASGAENKLRKQSFEECIFNGTDSAVSVFGIGFSEIKAFLSSLNEFEESLDNFALDRLSNSNGAYGKWCKFRIDAISRHPELAQDSIVARVRIRINECLKGIYPGKSGKVFAKTIMDFVMAGYFRWLGTNRVNHGGYQYFARDLETALVESINRYEEWEREHTLFFGPNFLDLARQVEEGDLLPDDFEELKRAGVPSSKHLMFFIDDEDESNPFCVLAIAASNGAIHFREGETPLYMVAEACVNEPRERVSRMINRALNFANVDPNNRELVLKPIPLKLNDVVMIPVQRGVKVCVLHEEEGVL